MSVPDLLKRAIEQEQAGRPAEALHLLGLLAFQTSRPEEAAARLREAIALDPGAPFYHNNLGNVLQVLGRFAEAVACYQEALRLDPGYAEAHSNLGTALLELGRFAESLAACEEAVRLAPGSPEAHNNLGNAEARLGRDAEAAGHYREALRLKPDYAEAHSNLGNVLLELGRSAEAGACYEQALRLEPNHARARWNRAWLLLLEGDLEQGFREYEWRWATGNAFPRAFAQPLWDGSPLAGRTILLHAEQGLGDTVQFIRYAPLVKRCGGRVLVECQRRLVPLVQTVSGVDAVVPAGEPLPPFDTHAPLLSLPRIFRTTLATIPADVPYLSSIGLQPCPPAGLPAPLRVGLAWAGSPAHKNDRVRSIPPEVLAPLHQIPGIAVWSVQEPCQEITDTAALLQSLDLLISADTMIAHLAGALGRPVWVLLSHVPDWRWMLGRGDSPWYPTMRLFRQPRLGDWDSVIERVCEELRRVVAQ